MVRVHGLPATAPPRSPEGAQAVFLGLLRAATTICAELHAAEAMADTDKEGAACTRERLDNPFLILNDPRDESHTTEQRIRKLMADGKLVLEPLTYIRGRSIPHQFMIVDEAQNLTPHEIKTIVSRVGEGTKVVLTGDIQQIDNPYLDQSSNGLSYIVEKMKGIPIVGHVMLTKSERSELASLAASML